MEDRVKQTGLKFYPVAEKSKPSLLSLPSDRYTAIFAGVAPATSPQLAVVVVIDEPSGDYYGGKVAAPVFSNIVAGATRILAIAPDDIDGDANSSLTLALRK